MAFEFKFPDVGEGIHEGEIVRWRVKEGEVVKEDQPLVEVETAKAIVELPSPKSGTVLKLIGKEGGQIHVGDVIVVIGEKGEAWTTPAQPALQNKQSDAASGAETRTAGASAPSAAPGVVGQIPTEEKGVVLPSRTPTHESAGGGAALVLPRIRKLAADMGVNLANVKGSGPGGQITEDDVKKDAGGGAGGGSGSAAKSTVNLAAPDISGPVERVPLKGIRKAIAEHMTISHRVIPSVTHMDEFDATALVKLREGKKAEAEKKNIKLTYLAYIVQAVCAALKKFPSLNAVFNDATGEEIIYRKYYNIGIAVDAPDGLMVPTIKDADKKDVLALAQEIADLAQKCRDRKISPAELQGGTFSITNIGSVGGTYATPIIVYGQAANLGLFRMKEKPVVKNGKIEIAPVMTLALSYDHRVVDGAKAARFMNEIIAILSPT